VRIGISLLAFSPGDGGSSETYAGQLIRALARNGTLDYAVLVPENARNGAEGLPTIQVDEPRSGKEGAPSPSLLARSARRARGAGGRIAALDVVHYALTAPLPSTDAPTVVTLHDIQHRDLPDFFGPARQSFRRTAYDRAARSAAAVVATSEFARERALEVLELDPTRIHVVPLAVDHDVFGPGDEVAEPFALYPARPWPHANHARLFEAFTALRQTRPRLRLVLTGDGHERLGTLPEAVESLGPVSATTLASLYRRAACLVLPSLYEGFGLPALQAMACGCPVAAADAGALPEVCGEAAVTFDPTDVEAMASAMVEADTRRDALRAKGFARAAQFTWESLARGHEEVYRSLT
jgi:glycosyltransferase involved in cell wall biosynthesis